MCTGISALWGRVASTSAVQKIQLSNWSPSQQEGHNSLVDPFFVTLDLLNFVGHSPLMNMLYVMRMRGP